MEDQEIIISAPEEIAGEYCSKKRLDNAYKERDLCIALIVRLASAMNFNVGILKHVGYAWEQGWQNVIFVDLPTGQLSWHIHDSELENFPNIHTYDGRWDGHTTEEKYERLKKYLHC